MYEIKKPKQDFRAVKCIIIGHESEAKSSSDFNLLLQNISWYKVERTVLRQIDIHSRRIPGQLFVWLENFKKVNVKARNPGINNWGWKSTENIRCFKQCEDANFLSLTMPYAYHLLST